MIRPSDEHHGSSAEGRAQYDRASLGLKRINPDGAWVETAFTIEDILSCNVTMIERIYLMMGGVGMDWGCCQRVASWAALVFLWGLGVFEFLTLSLIQSY